MTSDTRSDNECIPSATKPWDRANRPIETCADAKRMLTAMLTQVERAAALIIVGRKSHLLQQFGRTL